MGWGGDGGRGRSSFDEAFAFPSEQPSVGFCVFVICSERKNNKKPNKTRKTPCLGTLMRRPVIKHTRGHRKRHFEAAQAVLL